MNLISAIFGAGLGGAIGVFLGDCLLQLKKHFFLKKNSKEIYKFLDIYLKDYKGSEKAPKITASGIRLESGFGELSVQDIENAMFDLKKDLSKDIKIDGQETSDGVIFNFQRIQNNKSRLLITLKHLLTPL